MKKILLPIFFALLTTFTWAQTRYVAPTGSDAANDCKLPGSPCKTINYTIGQAVEGETISLAAGIYQENVSINKNSLKFSGSGAGNNPALHSIIATGGGGNPLFDGININSAITGTTIENLRINGFKSGIYGVRFNDNTTIQNVHVYDNNFVGGGNGGILLNGDVKNVLINNVEAVNNSSRGIVIWNGFKQNITITNCIVRNNNCCGIELQDGTASGVTIQNNNIFDNTDNGIGLVGLKGGAGANLIADNIVRNNGRFGIEIKVPEANGLQAGDGSTVVANNLVERTLNAVDLRDHAGIAVLRRGKLADNVDLPTGVVIKDNTVKGYLQNAPGSLSTGFGIVVGGTNMTILRNEVANCDVGIQFQVNPSNYPADANQNNVADIFFGRDNAQQTSGFALNNSLTGNAIGIRNAGVPDLIKATGNYWGDATGPTHAANIGGIGNAASNGVAYDPWLKPNPDADIAKIGVQLISPMTYVSKATIGLPAGFVNQAVILANGGDFIEANANFFNETVLVNKSVTISADNPNNKINNLDMNGNGKNLTIGSSFRIANNLNLNSGIINSTDVSFITINSNATISNGSETSYIIGFLGRELSTNVQTFLNFPMGSSTSFRPFILDITQDANLPTVYKGGMIEIDPNTLGYANPNNFEILPIRFYRLSKSAGANIVTATLTLNYSTAGKDDKVGDVTTLRILKEENGSWINVGGVGDKPGIGTITSDINFTKLGDFALGRTVILPITAVIEVTNVSCNGGQDGSALVSMISGGNPIIPGDYKITWKTNPEQQGKKAVLLEAGNYQVTIDDKNGHSKTFDFTVLQPAPMDISITENIVILKGSNTPLQATGGVTYSWSPALGLSDPNVANPVAAPNETTIYTVKITDANNCEGFASVTVTVIEKGQIALPNVFSPNGDGKNDTFKASGTGINKINLKIFNRLGQLLYESSDANEILNVGWDGTYRGTIQNNEAYIWFVTGFFLDGNEITTSNGKKTGTVLIMR